MIVPTPSSLQLQLHRKSLLAPVVKYINFTSSKKATKTILKVSDFDVMINKNKISFSYKKSQKKKKHNHRTHLQ